MLLSEYLSGLVKLIDEYSRTDLIIDSELTTDFRTEKIGIIKGSITFSNNSRLIFTEYLDLRYKAKKLNYSFHYQKQDGALIFRYDNAEHRPSVNASGHKHLPNGKIAAAEPPSLEAVFTEIIDFLLSEK
ncbi:MAG: hypothetical protein HY034_07735 [Nitrospirae bacterium]|nr:hypothetical protein [Nitrospirota bacterium]